MTRPERLAALVCVLCALAALVCVLCALAAVLLSACATKPEPEVLPHYPCTKQENGRTVYFACSADEWLMQQILKGKQ